MPIRWFQRLASLAWLEFSRILRGRRWRAYFLLSIVGAYWFGRQASFGTGSLVWFPGAEFGIKLFSCYFAGVAALLGSDALGQWIRGGASRLLDPRLRFPVLFLSSRLLAITAACLPPAVMVVYWPVIGAWRAEYEVVWTPNGLYLLCGALPLIVAGGAVGLFAAALMRRDTPALILSALLLSPILYFRLVSAPIAEVFDFATATLGVLVPRQTLLRESVTVMLSGFLFIGLAALLIPAPSARQFPRARRLALFRAPKFRTLLSALRLRTRQATWGTVAMALGFVGVGLSSGSYLLTKLSPDGSDVNWFGVREPDGTVTGQIREVRITDRRITLPTEIGKPIRMELDLRSFYGEQNQAAIYFGSSVKPVSAAAPDQSATIEHDASPDPRHLAVIQFSAPLTPDNDTTVAFEVVPTTQSYREWERAFHPKFHRFAFLGPWFGESARLDYRFQSWGVVSQASPFTIDAPDPAPLAWACGSAMVREAGNRVLIEQARNGTPQRLIAAELSSFPATDERHIEVTFLLLKSREELGENIHAIYHESFVRLKRAFGNPPNPIVFYEVPEQSPEDALALPSPQMDEFEAWLPNYGDYQMNSEPAFLLKFPPLNKAIVDEMFAKTFTGYESRELFRIGLAEYLHTIALARGLDTEYRRRARKDVVFIPWQDMRGVEVPLVQLKPGERPRWEGPIFPELRNPLSPEVDPRRFFAFHHLLRGLVGEEPFRRGITELFTNHRGEALTVALYKEVMEAESGEDLDRFFNEWLYEGVLPEYRVKQAQAFLIEDPATRALNYRTEVEIANEGTGTMPVPWVLGTEGASVRKTEILGPGEVRTISVSTLDRPILFEIDPYGWLVHAPPEKKDLSGAEDRRVFFKNVVQMIGGPS